MLTQTQGRFSEAGFLPARYKPFATGGDPAQSRFVVEGVVAPGVTDQQQRDRRELLAKLNTFEHALTATLAQGAAESEKQAYELILGDEGKLFDLSKRRTNCGTATAATRSGNRA